MTNLEESILKMVRNVEADERRIGVLSTGEKIAVAMVLDRKDLLEWGSMLESAERLGPEWFKACLNVQRAIR
jgi:hypothetical protein